MPTITLDRLAHGGDAVGRLDGKATFVPLGAPGDVAEIEIESDRDRWVRGRLLRIEAPGATRTEPACRHFGICGGCQWQHLAIEVQQSAKHAIVVDQLARIGGLGHVDVRPILAGPVWGYRDRVSLARRDGVLGLRALRSHDVVPIDACPIAAAPVAAALGSARTLADALGPAVRKVSIVAADEGVVLTAAGGKPVATVARAAWAAAGPALRGLVWVGTGRRLTLGDVTIRRRLEDDLDLVAPADVFMQVSGWTLGTLVAQVVALAGPVAGRTVLDLYCGSGALGLPLAHRGARVHGIERERRAVAAARANAARLALPDFVAVAGDVRTALRQAPPADLVVLDPPRRGAAELLDGLLARRPPVIVYVSCDPATFARDAGRLVRGGYALGPVQPIDAFPHSYHLELVAALRLT